MYKYFAALSLDIVSGAIFTCWAIGVSFSLVLPPVVYGCLGISVWIIYTLDHLLDAKKLKHIQLSFRHDIHLKFSRTLTATLVLAGLFLAYLLFSLPAPLIRWGLALSALILTLRFAELRWSLPTKEITTAVFYTAGLMLAPLVYSESLRIFVLFLPLIHLSLLNTFLLAFFDYGRETRMEGKSFATRFGILKTMKVIRFLLLPGLAGPAVFLYLSTQQLELVPWVIFYLTGVLIFGLLFRSRAYFLQRIGWYRFISDGVFLIPGILIYLFQYGF